jgi:CheY-like chemotaxis protein
VAAGDTKTVLLVDDEEFFCKSLRVVLSTRIADVRVLEARDGRAALEILQREGVDSVVTDLVMPGMDGTALLAEMITRRIRVPVIVVSAYAHAAPPIDGALSCLSKPVDLGVLCATIARSLSAEGRAAGQATSIGLLHVLACRLSTCTVQVTSRAGGATRRGFVSMRRGRLVQARVWVGDCVALARVGLDAAADILGWE